MTRNRFEILNKNNECDGSATSLYDNFVKDNEETSNLLIPNKEKLKIKIISEDTRIIAARDKVNVDFSTYSKTPTGSNQYTLRYVKRNYDQNMMILNLKILIEIFKGLHRKISYPNTQPVGN